MTTAELIKRMREKQSRDNRKLLDEAAEEIERYDWQPVSEPPKYGELVLVCLRLRSGKLTYATTYYDDCGWEIDSIQSTLVKIIAWQHIRPYEVQK